MKPYFLLTILSLLVNNILGQYNDPNFPKPTSGYGTDGSHSVGLISFTNPNYLLKKIEIYYPSDIATPVPTIFYSHAFGGSSSDNIVSMLNFVAQKGYAIVYVPYQTTGVSVTDRYNNLTKGFAKAAREYSNIIDTNKVGFMGHSFGGGASFGIGYKYFTQNNWGKNGRFIYALAQWYSYNISQAELQKIPSDTKLLTEIFNDDITNDHRMAVEIFNNVNIPTSEKDFLLLKSDTLGGHIYLADHVVPNTTVFDAYDYYAYYRFIDALCDYTFNGNINGKNTALGNGSTAQITMPAGLTNLAQTDNPSVVFSESKYQFSCSDTLNPRIPYCPTPLFTNDNSLDKNTLSAYPNPASEFLNVDLPNPLSDNPINIYNTQSELVLSIQKNQASTITIDLGNLKNGLYLLKIGHLKTKIMIEK